MNTSVVIFEDAEHGIVPLATTAAKGMVWHFRPAENPDGFGALRDVPFDGSIPVRVMVRKKSGPATTYHVERVVRTSW